MRLKVLLFGRLHEFAGGVREFECEVPGRATVAAAWQAVTDRYPAASPYAGSVSAAVNAEFARMTTEVGEGDEVAFLPPVAGG
jgi:molybdopterin converting factor small subunit